MELSETTLTHEPMHSPPMTRASPEESSAPTTPKRSLLHTDTITDDLKNAVELTTLSSPGTPGKSAQIRLAKGTSIIENMPTSTGGEMMQVQHTTAYPTDLLMNIPRAELLRIVPEVSGWYAELLIDAETERAVNAFNVACKEHLEAIIEDEHPRVHIEPCAACLEDYHSGFTAKISVKISEWSGRLMNSSVFNTEDELVFAPRDKLSDVHTHMLTGQCAVRVHLMGFWYDKTKSGLHVYLDRLGFLPMPKLPISLAQPTMSTAEAMDMSSDYDEISPASSLAGSPSSITADFESKSRECAKKRLMERFVAGDEAIRSKSISPSRFRRSAFKKPIKRSLEFAPCPAC